jgi:hypothetical protein
VIRQYSSTVVLQHVGQGLTLAQSVAQAVADLRKEYPKSSYNCMVQSQDEMVCLRASGRTDVPARIGDIYARYGRLTMLQTIELFATKKFSMPTVQRRVWS